MYFLGRTRALVAFHTFHVRLGQNIFGPGSEDLPLAPNVAPRLNCRLASKDDLKLLIRNEPNNAGTWKKSVERCNKCDHRRYDQKYRHWARRSKAEEFFAIRPEK